jgi:hypothetical protein
MCELYSYRKVCFDIKRTRVLYDSYVLFQEASSCFFEDIYEVLIFFYRFFLRVEDHNLGSINLDGEQDPVKVVDTHIQMKFLYTYYQMEGMKKRVKGLS